MTYRRDPRRRQDTSWPHFDRRGPDYYYDGERYPERSNDGYRNGERYSQRYEDSDIYEDEFLPEDDRYFRYHDREEHWPEDRFYDHRQQPMPPRENFFERTWHRFQDRHNRIGREPIYDHYPEDRHHGHHGQEYRSHNGNRGWGGRDRFVW